MIARTQPMSRFCRSRIRSGGRGGRGTRAEPPGGRLFGGARRPAGREVPEVVLGEVAGSDQQFNVADAQVGRGPAEHPRRGVVLVLVDRLVEVDLIEVAQQRKAMERDAAKLDIARSGSAGRRHPSSRFLLDFSGQRDVSSPTTLPRLPLPCGGNSSLTRSESRSITASASARPGVVPMLAGPDAGHPRGTRAGDVLAAAVSHHRAEARLDTQAVQGGGEDLGSRLAPADLTGEGLAVEEAGQPEVCELEAEVDGTVGGVGADAETEATSPELPPGSPPSQVTRRPPPTRPACTSAATTSLCSSDSRMPSAAYA